jgi:DNA-binding response OmpR family regulator
VTPVSAVLIAHDPWVRHVVQTGLAPPTYQVLTASNGVSGLRLVKRELPQLLLIEMSVPELSGAEVIDEVRRLDLVDPPLIIVVNADPTASAPTCGRAVDGVLAAPFTAEDVVGRVEWVRSSRRPRARTDRVQARPDIAELSRPLSMQQ